MIFKLFCLIIGIMGSISKADAAKLLFVIAPTIDSHRRSLYPLASALGKRGHDVTMFMEGLPGFNKNASQKESENIKNHIFMLENQKSMMLGMEKSLQVLTWETSHTSSIGITDPWIFFGQLTQSAIDQNRSTFDDLLFKPKWDLVLTDAIFTPLGIVVALVSQSPIVCVYTTALQAGHMIQRPIPYPWSFVPTFYMDSHVYDHRNFYHRLKSVLEDITEVLVTHFVNWYVIKGYFSKYHDESSLDVLYRKSRFVMLGFPQALNYIHPLTHDVIFTAGTCKRDLPSIAIDADLKQFLEDENSKGTIVVAFGHVVKWNQAPNDVKKNFIFALNSFKDYRIVWQFNENTEDLNIGTHIRCMTWLPQEALLRHPTTKLFISHGGLKSVTESICAGVPAVVIPFFAEQIRNAHLLEKARSGLVLSKFELTTENIVRAAIEVLTNDTYGRSIRKLRDFMNDQPIDSLDNAIFWTEFFVRHKNVPEGKFFRLRHTYMSWVQYLMIDILLVFLGCVFGVVGFVIFYHKLIR